MEKQMGMEDWKAMAIQAMNGFTDLPGTLRASYLLGTCTKGMWKHAVSEIKSKHGAEIKAGVVKLCKWGTIQPSEAAVKDVVQKVLAKNGIPAYPEVVMALMNPIGESGFQTRLTQGEGTWPVQVNAAGEQGELPLGAEQLALPLPPKIKSGDIVKLKGDPSKTGVVLDISSDGKMAMLEHSGGMESEVPVVELELTDVDTSVSPEGPGPEQPDLPNIGSGPAHPSLAANGDIISENSALMETLASAVSFVRVKAEIEGGEIKVGDVVTPSGLPAERIYTVKEINGDMLTLMDDKDAVVQVNIADVTKGKMETLASAVSFVRVKAETNPDTGKDIDPNTGEDFDPDPNIKVGSTVREEMVPGHEAEAFVGIVKSINTADNVATVEWDLTKLTPEKIKELNIPVPSQEMLSSLVFVK